MQLDLLMVKDQLAEAISLVILNQDRQQLQTIIIQVLVIPEPDHLIPDQVLVLPVLQLQHEKQVAVKAIQDRQLQVPRKAVLIVALPIALAAEVAVVTADLPVALAAEVT